MPHALEPATSGRAKCRGCGRAIAKDELRFGERLPNPFGDGEMTLWFHPGCAAYKRPEPLMETLVASPEDFPGRSALEQRAQNSLSHRRLPRIDGAERAPGAQAKCRHCREPIERGNWRIRLVYFEEGMFSAGGFIHLGCRKDYFETPEVDAQILHFSGDLSSEEMDALRLACASN